MFSVLRCGVERIQLTGNVFLYLISNQKKMFTKHKVFEQIFHHLHVLKRKQKIKNFNVTIISSSFPQ